jgi:hypothetical protein
MEKIQVKAAIPVAIPGKLPQYFDLNTKKMFSIITVHKDFYAVGITRRSDCDGSKGCEEITFIGSSSLTNIEEHKDEKPIPVILGNGDKALYYDAICGASCTNSQLAWKHGSFYYVIDEAGEQETAVNLANSMIYGKPASKPKR